MEKLFKSLEKSTKDDTVCGKFIKERDRYANLIFFGASQCCFDMLKLFKKENLKLPIAICDNDTKKHGTTLLGIPIISLNEAKEKYDDIHVLLLVPGHAKILLNQLKSELKEDQISFFMPSEYSEYDKTIKYLKENRNQLQVVHDNLNDEKSKEVYQAALLGRCSGNCDNYIKVFEDNQYFPRDIVNLENDVFLDIGGYIGDTIEQFIEITNGNYDKIISFEPNPNNHKRIEHVVNKSKNVTLIKKGISDKSELLNFSISDGFDSSASFDTEANDFQIEVDSIDNLINEKITFIKMDIEGLEMRALHGGINTIKKYKPKLAICIYHKISDFVEVYNFIASLDLGYKFYVRHHSFAQFETVMYAL